MKTMQLQYRVYRVQGKQSYLVSTDRQHADDNGKKDKTIKDFKRLVQHGLSIGIEPDKL